ncbi:MAG TPA: hypothetical protein VME63_10450 [Dyella sp.]|uniref:hypothetical protein n=1 Tax=Dyella sp. TaxID=1869338 RepID=UPI002B64E62D|nr:hypothetical protein [Dyella sp.]HTV85820.1 hypothetical protein [Dyella sp.]
MKNPKAFYGLTITVLTVAGLLIAIYGVPMLSEQDSPCHYAGTTSFGCSSSFGTFMTFLSAGVALAIGGIWTLFGR